jgi:hypothetical protein
MVDDLFDRFGATIRVVFSSGKRKNDLRAESTPAEGGGSMRIATCCPREFVPTCSSQPDGMTPDSRTFDRDGVTIG